MVGKHRQSIPHLGGEFAGMIRMDTHPERMMLLEHPAEFRGDALRQEDRHPGPDAQEFEMRDRPQPCQEGIQLVIRKEQRIPTREQHIADLRV